MYISYWEITKANNTFFCRTQGSCYQTAVFYLRTLSISKIYSVSDIYIYI